MLGKGLAYGWLAARRRIGEMVLPVITTATGAFLVVIVFGMSDGIRAQSASLGHADEIGRAVVLIAVTVLLVGVVEVAVATTRTVAHRTRELGVLGANGVPRTPVVAALLVEQVIAGEFVCLRGPSGSGKSTLLNMIGGLDRPTKGTIKLAGRDTSLLTESQFAALRHDTIGFIFQSYNLIPFLSAVENVELPLMFEPYDRKSLRKRAMELLNLVGLGHRIHHQPTKMSGGEQQRTAIARSLISSPTLVLADEPTANLDHRTEETVVRMLRDLCSTIGVTVVASTHDPTVADEASRVVRMKDGQIVN